MSTITRRDFLHTSAMLFGATLVAPSYLKRKKERLLSFSTLGCPDWDLQQIVSFAAAHGYQGIELRGLQRQMDLPQSPGFNNAAGIDSTMQLMKENKLRFVGLGSSATLHFAEGTERDKNLEDGRRFIDLAEKINCPYVRVFPNNFPADTDRQITIDRIADGLLELGNYAQKKNVIVLMETHGDAVWIADLEKIMSAASHTHVGLVWDVSNMWTVTKEPVQDAYQRLKKYIRHTHLKDAALVNGKLQYKLLGRGEVPVFNAIAALDEGGYKGFYSFEWEKMWHPELDAPEIALADFPLAMKKHKKK